MPVTPHRRPPDPASLPVVTRRLLVLAAVVPMAALVLGGQPPGSAVLGETNHAPAPEPPPKASFAWVFC